MSTVTTPLSTVSSTPNNNNTNHHNDTVYRVYLGVGSNLGHRFDNIQRGLQRLCQGHSTQLLRTSFLHETAPMYVHDQPAFLNGAVELETSLEPHTLLHELKRIEHDLGRNRTSPIRNGPRPLDLDILMVQRHNDSQPVLVNTETLQVPHPRMAERAFVLQPLREVAGDDCRHPETNLTLQEMLQTLRDNHNDMVRVLPLPRRNRLLVFNETLVMGILNVTPDSFSDGGQWTSTQTAVDRALQMEREGAHIVDIGGESTRPGADAVSLQEELRRTIPVIQGIRRVSDTLPLSIDTRNAAVARAAVEAGADLVNDVSGGRHDPDMLSTVAELGVPMVLMHMRGTPQTMQRMTAYNNVVEDVAHALCERIRAAEAAGIPRWLHVVDPGIGFAKDLQGNLRLLQQLDKIRAAVQDVPMLLGTSRKGFLGKLTGVTTAEDRDHATVASMVAALCLEGRKTTCTILRVHNVAAARQATQVMDAIRKQSE